MDFVSYVLIPLIVSIIFWLIALIIIKDGDKNE